MMLVIAPLESCDVATGNQAFVRRAIRWRFQKHTRLSVSVTRTAMNHRGFTRSRSLYDPSTDRIAGKRRYSDTAVTASMRIRMTTLRRLGLATVPVAFVSSIAALIAATRVGMGGSVSPE